MSSFGALPLSAKALRFGAVVASANKCLQGAPGVGFALIERPLLEMSQGNCPSLSFDLYAQWRGFVRSGQWRFTPPTHVVAALAQALKEFATEGGAIARGARYRQNYEVLNAGMVERGFEPLLPHALQAPIIVTYLMPQDSRFVFDTFYAQLAARGFVIYPGKLTQAQSFRIGCIGDVDADTMRSLLDAIDAVLRDMGFANGCV